MYQAFLHKYPRYFDFVSIVTTRLIPTSLSVRLMNMKNGKRAIAVTLAVITLLALAPTAHAQNITGQYDRASYVPGDSGTLTVSIVNNNAQDTVEIRNITVYYPWAAMINGKWDGANVTINLSAWKTLGSLGSGNNIYTTSLGFTVPSWYGGSPFGSIFGGGNLCPGSRGPRYGLYSGCILVGVTANPPMYETQDLNIQMALATYTPTSLIAEWLPIATLVVLVVATVFLGMAWMSLRRSSKKA
jgi:hypothetical protein